MDPAIESTDCETTAPSPTAPLIGASGGRRPQRPRLTEITARSYWIEREMTADLKRVERHYSRKRRRIL